MNYMTIKEASALWNIDGSRIGKLLKEGKITGAEKQGGHWYIPKDAPRPADGRTRAGKNPESDYYRFPLFINKKADGFFPPLTEEELLLRQAQVDFFACDFEKAAAGFSLLKARTGNIHIRICALLFECILSAIYKKGTNFKSLLHMLRLELARDIPHKHETQLCLPWLYSLLGHYTATSECLAIVPDCEYHPSVYPLLSYLTIHRGIQNGSAITGPEVYTILCRTLEYDGNYYEAQELHAMLFCLYTSLANEKAALFHLKQALKIAKEHNLIFIAACYESYFPDMYHTVLHAFPKDFSEKILHVSAEIRESYAEFASSCKITDMFAVLSEDDFRYILYIMEGFKYREIAKHVHLSERTVAAKYSRIFEKLGVKNRQELTAHFADAAAGLNRS